VKILNLKENSKKIKEEDYKMYTIYEPNIFCCDIPDISFRMKKIYFGPKVTAKKIEFIQDLLRKKGFGHITCKKSTNPLA